MRYAHLGLFLGILSCSYLIHVLLSIDMMYGYKKNTYIIGVWLAAMHVNQCLSLSFLTNLNYLKSVLRLAGTEMSHQRWMIMYYNIRLYVYVFIVYYNPEGEFL